MTPGLRLRVALPEGAAAEPDTALPTVDLSSVPGAAVVLRRGFTAEGSVSLRVLCARAPSDRWAPGVEELVLGRVNAITAGALGGEVERLDAGEVAQVDERFEQRFEGAARSPSGARVSARGKHLLGFTGEARDVVLCTLVCLEPAAPSADAAAGRCAALIDAAAPEGVFALAPAPSLLVQAILLTAERPQGVMMTGGLIMLAAVTWILARRPRPRW